MTLTVNTIRSAQPREKGYKLGDGKGLFLFIHPSGSKYWRLKYRFGGKEKSLSMGVFPEVSLKEARIRRDKARLLIAEGIDPSAKKQQEKLLRYEASDDSFQALAIDWYQRKQSAWSDSHKARVNRLLHKDLFPWIGERPANEINPPELLRTLRRIEERGAINSAKRAKQLAGQIFRYGIATGKCRQDPSQGLSDALESEVKTHFASITDPQEVGELLRMLDGYRGSNVVRAALRLAPLTFVRPGELRMARWSEIDLESAIWEIPADRMKMKQPHIVPLSRQAVEALIDIQPLTGRFEFVFTSGRTGRRAMSENAVLAAMRRLGIPKEKMSGHGFRAMARTLLDEVLEYRTDWIEAQLAHAVRDPNGRAYNRTAYLKQRAEMMQRWADYLDELRITV